MLQIVRGARASLGCLLFCVSPLLCAQYVSLVGGTPPVQTFDTLAASGTGTALPDGWYIAESGSNADSSYAADDGSVISGNSYSYGATGSSDRALGGLQSGSLNPTIGAHLRNDAGQTLTQIVVSYTGEQWRLGVSGRQDRLQAQYSVNATALNDSAATWTNVAALDFATPNTAAAVGKLDGNIAANRTTISAAITGLNLAPSAALWLRWIDVNVSGNDDGLAIDDISFAVDGTPPPDVPPTVSATTPTNGASQVALASTLSVTFSEAVTLAPTWFTLNCSVSGMHTAAMGGGPVQYSLAPDAAFATNESCTFTVLASGVSDQDGTPDAMAADYSVTFTTFDGVTPAPTVLSTLPANGVMNVPVTSDVRVTFSDTVVTTNAAFTLTCNAAPVSLIQTGTGAARILTPNANLPAAASCTFTIVAAQVQNTGGTPMVADVNVTFGTASGNNGDYYGQVNTSSPDQLRCSLHAIIRNHTVYPYSGGTTNTWTMLEAAQANPANPNQILDVYRNHYYTAVSGRAGTGSGITYNREHTWPNSHGFPSTTGDLGLDNAPYTDGHMLYLSDTQWNADRGNKPYANCASCSERTTEANAGFGGGSGTYPGNSNWTDANSFEGWNHRKGDLARAVLYMAIRYEGGVDSRGQHEPDLELTDDRSKITTTSDFTHPAYMGMLTDLLAWNAGDPPDAEERARDEVIYQFQGNRNPFVDHPEWATRALFESTTPATCMLGSNDRIFADGFGN
jgi:endonuclease I